jgi:putative transposon-encoded protein
MNVCETGPYSTTRNPTAMAAQKKERISRNPVSPEAKGGKAFRVKFEVFGEEMIEKEVKQSGNSGRVYLPPEWVGKQVKIIRID